MSGEDLVRRADSLMRRSFVARTGPLPPPAETGHTPPAGQESDDDIPVLTEVVLPDAPAHAARNARETPDDRLAADFLRLLEARLGDELPRLVETGLAAFKADLQRSLAELAEDVAHDLRAGRHGLEAGPRNIPERKD